MNQVIKLSKNFSLQEMLKSEVALRRGLPNQPGPTEEANLRLLVEHVLQPVRDRFGPTKINSGYRDPAINAVVGGSERSHHCTGQAADIEVPGVPNGDLARWIVEHCAFTQVILELYTPGIPDSGWVHVAYDAANLKREVLTSIREGGRLVFKPGLIIASGAHPPHKA